MFLPGSNHDLRNKIFNAQNGMLGAIGNKVDLARALNLIDQDLHHDIVLLCRIRNAFAHSLEVDSFDHQAVSCHIDDLRSAVAGFVWTGIGVG